jgi:uncharacterized protein YggT (Ycf19 family)
MNGKAQLSIVRAARVLTYFVYGFTIVALVILGLGFFLLLFGANPDAPFAEWVYRSLNRVMAPFRGIFEPVPLNGDSVLDTSVLFAMIVYGLAAMLLTALIDWLTQRLTLLRSRAAMLLAREEEANRHPAAV